MVVISNPLFNNSIYSKSYSNDTSTMTLNGTLNKTLTLLGITSITALVAIFALSTTLQTILMILGLIGGLIFVIICGFSPKNSKIYAPLYAICEGLVLGPISANFETIYPGIVISTLIATLSVAGILCLVYKFKLIPIDNKFITGTVIATGGLAAMYFITFLLSLFGFSTLNFMYSGTIGLAINIIALILASANLLIDFEFIFRGIKSNLPKYMEWYNAMGVLVTLVWMYLELLRLLSRLRD